ncbi:MAG: hypothetical protein DWQ36_06110 [Acidobacteria bacterium]|nr:MAG: hypothetical protein DWQ30_19115 [Acidobacteriota bacterium]REK09622.1 MAG: hypothetical protein DWQ36_06110 [Acidobacteriota bacterium]
MPKNKDLKRRIRQRMEKTGESYTAARAQILKQTLPPDERLAELAGVKDETVKARTGRTWKQWVQTLDAMDAISMTHTEIARRVAEQGDFSGWWAQSVTVGYERIRGLRAVGQRRTDKTFEGSKSKTVAAPVAGVYAAFVDGRKRRRWLPDVDWTIRTRQENRSLRITWPDDTSVHVYLVPKGEEKTQISVQHVGLADQADIERRKEFWGDRLTALAEML